MMKTLCLLWMITVALWANELPVADHPYGVMAGDSRLDELGKDLEMPAVSETGLVQTTNYGGGFMMIHLDPIGAKFVDFVKTSSYPVLDIGSAFGVATIPALKNSNCLVIADDIGVDNLLILRKQADQNDRLRLYLNSKRFPQELDFPANSLGAFNSMS